jgi:hypothetical protein
VIKRSKKAWALAQNLIDVGLKPIYTSLLFKLTALKCRAIDTDKME